MESPPACQNPEAGEEENPLVHETVWFRQQLYEEAEATYHVHLETERKLQDPTQLDLEIDGEIKPFSEWTLKYADDYFPDLDKNVYSIPPIPFYPPTVGADRLSPQSEDSINEDGRQQNSAADPEQAASHVENEGQSQSGTTGNEDYEDLGKVTVHKVNIDKTKEHSSTEQYVLKGSPNKGNVIGVQREKAVREALDRLGQKLGSLFCIYNYDFDNYLKELQLQLKYETPGRKEVDVIVLNQDSGPVLIEVKEAQFDEGCNKKRQRPKVMTVLKKAGDQLDQDERLFHRISKGIDPTPAVTKVIALPNLPRADLDWMLNVRPKPDVARFTFLCKDDLSEIHTWWETHVLKSKKPISLLTMRSIVGRLAGLLSTVAVPSLDKKRVEVRTFGEAVQEVGRQMSLIVLTKQQREILDCPDRTVHIRGPPGSGKTLLLALKAVRSLEMGKVVYVGGLQRNGNGELTADNARDAAFKKMVEELCLHKNIDFISNLTGRSPAEVLGVSVPYFTDQEELNALLILKKKQERDVIFILDDFYAIGPQDTHSHLRKLSDSGGSVWWASSCTDDETSLDEFTTFTLNMVLRCPPVIQRLLKKLEPVALWEPSYCEKGENAGFPTDGPTLCLVHHSSHRSEACPDPSQCKQCAEYVGKILQRLMSVPQGSSTQLSSTVGYKDILFLSQTVEDQSYLGRALNAKRDLTMFISQPSWVSGAHKTVCSMWEMNSRSLADDVFYIQLREACGVPLNVCDSHCQARFILGNPGQEILATYEKYSWGLERTVVVFIMTSEDSESEGAVAPGHEDKTSAPAVQHVREVPDSILESLSPHQRNMLYLAASRCISQLIIVLP